MASFRSGQTGGQDNRQKFIGRQRELSVLRNELHSGKPSLVIIYGRRRVGKSRLILESVKDAPHIYFQATRLMDALNIQQFRQAIKTFTRHDDPILQSLASWDSVFAYVRHVADRELQPLTVVIDEFPYLCEDVNPALPSVIQRFWDDIERDGIPLNLVLCGSSMAFMEGLLSERNPLYGRQTCKLKVEPLTLRETAAFFQGWTADDKLRAFAIFGGVPFYFNQCDPTQSLQDNICQVILADGSPLREEPDHVLQSELRSVERYSAILQAIASGCTRIGEILGRVPDLKSATDVTYYLSRLQQLQLIRRESSLDRRDRAKERNALYLINDPLMMFWYRFVLPNVSALRAGYVNEVYEKVIAPSLDEYLGDAFERICRAHMVLHGPEIVDEPAQEVGKIWSADSDIDVAGRTLSRGYFFGECKWWNSAVGGNVLSRLRMAIENTTYGRDDSDRHELLFSRSGFTPELRQLAEGNSALALIGLADLLGTNSIAQH